MWKSKKFIIAAVLATVLILSSIGAFAAAADDEIVSEGPGAHFTALWDRVATILQSKGVTVTADQLKESFDEARAELCPEGMNRRGDFDPQNMLPRGNFSTEEILSRLDTQLAEGKITQEQYDSMKSRIESMPEGMPSFGFRGGKGFHGMGTPPDFGERGSFNE